jgi:hypothetical protein
VAGPAGRDGEAGRDGKDGVVGPGLPGTCSQEEHAVLRALLVCFALLDAIIIVLVGSVFWRARTTN